MAKGGGFEREMCKKLSLWWTSGKSDDIFWRTSGSGARATTRAKSNKATFGQSGDVGATHPDGLPLINLFVIELKRGYPKASIIECFDQDNAALQEYEIWINRMYEEVGRDEKLGWILIHRRDRRNAQMWMDGNAFEYIRARAGQLPNKQCVEASIRIRSMKKSDDGKRLVPCAPYWLVNVIGMMLDDFLEYMGPGLVKGLEQSIDLKEIHNEVED